MAVTGIAIRTSSGNITSSVGVSELQERQNLEVEALQSIFGVSHTSTTFYYFYIEEIYVWVRFFTLCSRNIFTLYQKVIPFLSE